MSQAVDITSGSTVTLEMRSCIVRYCMADMQNFLCHFHSSSAEESHQFPPKPLRESQSRLLNNGQSEGSEDRDKQGDSTVMPHLITKHC